MEHVLREIYHDLRPISTQQLGSWRHWLNVYVAADKYLEPGTRAQAYNYVRTIARSLKDTDAIFDLFEALDDEMTRFDVFVELAAELQKTHLYDLIKNERFRRHIERDTAAVWKIVDTLHAAQDRRTSDSVPMSELIMRKRRRPS